MLIENHFDVPLSLSQTWDTLLDIRRVAPCVPGAELTDVVDERTYKGKVTVKLGPVALAFAGRITFEEIDAEMHTARLRAQGTDSKGRGGANAVVRFSLLSREDVTRVLVKTDLSLSGSVAQYGRAAGVVQQTAAQILAQFARNLAEQLADERTARAGGATAPRSPTTAKPLSLLALAVGLFRQALATLLQRRSVR